MSDDLRLRENLAKLSTLETSLGQNRIFGPDVPSLLASMLREIDETILPRKISFLNDTGRVLQFEVAGRRLLRVSGEIPEGGGVSGAGLLGQVLSDAEGPLMSALFDQLGDFLSETGSLLATAQKTTEASDPSEVGCSAESIAQAWGLDLYDVRDRDFSEVVEKLITACSDEAIAWIQLHSKDVTGSGGDPVHLAPLKNISEEQISDFDAHLMRNPVPQNTFGCIVLGSGLSDSRSLFFARFEDTRAFISTPNTALPRILTLWKDLCRG